MKKRLIIDEVVRKFKTASSTLILLDYDGTLVDYNARPEHAVPPLQLLNILTDLSGVPQADVVIVSGRAHKDIDRFVGHLPVDIIAEHGAIFKRQGVWKTEISGAQSWKPIVRPVMEKAVTICNGSFVEEKEYSLVWHYRTAETRAGYHYSRNLLANLEDIISSNDLKLLDGNKVIEVLPQQIGKGVAIREVISRGDYDYIIAIGDDKTDEEMFEVLWNVNHADTIKIGPGKTSARYKLDNVKDVYKLLKHLSNREMENRKHNHESND